MKNVAVLTEGGAFVLFCRPHPAGVFDSSRVLAIYGKEFLLFVILVIWKWLICYFLYKTTNKKHVCMYVWVPTSGNLPSEAKTVLMPGEGGAGRRWNWLVHYFPENFRCNLTCYERDNFSDSYLNRIFQPETALLGEWSVKN